MNIVRSYGSGQVWRSCYLAKPGNKTAAPSWPELYVHIKIDIIIHICARNISAHVYIPMNIWTFEYIHDPVIFFVILDKMCSCYLKKDLCWHPLWATVLVSVVFPITVLDLSINAYIHGFPHKRHPTVKLSLFNTKVPFIRVKQVVPIGLDRIAIHNEHISIPVC